MVRSEQIKEFLTIIETVGSGDGYGSGHGDGDGDGNGNGSGYGYGYRSGDKSNDYTFSFEKEPKFFLGYSKNKKAKLFQFFGQQVVYIDEIPCIIHSIKRGLAKVSTINIDNAYETKEMYVAKYNNCFAHGYTPREAIDLAINKFYSTLNVEDRIAQFKKEFSDYFIQYPNILFYQWHSILTGSCIPGKEMFVKDKNIDLKGTMTVFEFIDYCKNEYNGHVIKKLL